MEKNRLRKIAVLGAESTGKTWLCEQLAAYYNTAWVPEYAREYFNDSDIYNYTLQDLEIIAEKQIAIEHAMEPLASGFLFSDTSLITLKIWAELEFKTVPKIIAQQIHAVHYDHYLITDNSIAWAEDPLRQNKFSRDLIMKMNVEEVKSNSFPYSIVTGSEIERLKSAIKILEQIR